MENFLILDGLNEASTGEGRDETKIAQAKIKVGAIDGPVAVRAYNKIIDECQRNLGYSQENVR